MMGRNPLDRSQAHWQEQEGMAIDGIAARVWIRKVHDGRMTAIVAEEPGGWHLSISHQHKTPGARRYPGWDEIAQARYLLLPAGLTFVMYLPPLSEYVSVHDTTFHLYQEGYRE